jgi:predicted MFS family arabinose efflux permease
MKHTTDRDAALSEWKSGWPLTLSASLGLAVSLIHMYSLGVFIEPLERTFGWSRGDISAGPAIVSVFFVIASPFVGMLLDRYSARKIALPGLMIYCCGLALLGATGPSIWSWWGGWVVMAVGATCSSATVWTLGVARRFKLTRGLALSLTLAGTGLCIGLAPVLTKSLIDHFNWRGAYLGLGCVAALIALPMVTLFFHDGGGSERSRGRTVLSEEAGLTVRESLLSGRFWRLGLASFLVCTGTLAMIVHFVPILTGAGLDRGTAVMITGLVGLSSSISRVGTGFLLDRVRCTVVGAIAFAAPAVACILLLVQAGSVTASAIAAIGLGFGLGAEVDVVAYATTRYFGLRHYGVLFGVINALLKISLGVGPFVGGLLYDHFGSYTALIAGLIATSLVSAALMLSLGDYPVFQPVPAET